jgi:hypothetical protein
VRSRVHHFPSREERRRQEPRLQEGVREARRMWTVPPSPVWDSSMEHRFLPEAVEALAAQTYCVRTLVLTAVVFGMKDNEVQVQIHQIPSHLLFLPPRLASIANISSPQIVRVCRRGTSMHIRMSTNQQRAWSRPARLDPEGCPWAADKYQQDVDVPH